MQLYCTPLTKCTQHPKRDEYSTNSLPNWHPQSYLKKKAPPPPSPSSGHNHTGSIINNPIPIHTTPTRAAKQKLCISILRVRSFYTPLRISRPWIPPQKKDKKSLLLSTKTIPKGKKFKNEASNDVVQNEIAALVHIQ